jgi:hypothetical protein
MGLHSPNMPFLPTVQITVCYDADRSRHTNPLVASRFSADSKFNWSGFVRHDPSLSDAHHRVI